LAAKRKGFAAVRSVAVADVERLQVLQRMLAGDAFAVSAAVERPVVKHGEVAIGGRMHVELDDVGACSEGGLDGGNRVLEIRMRGRVNACGGAAVVGDAVEIEGLRQPAMRQQNGTASGRAAQPVGIVEIDETGEQENERAGDADDPSHGSAWRGNAALARSRT
jgi:hypothetical protein